MEIKNTKDKTQSGITGILYGKPGSGKSTFAATAPGCLLANIEGGQKVLENDAVGLYTDYADIAGLADLRDFAEYVAEHRDEIGTVALDTITELGHMIMDEILGSDRAAKLRAKNVMLSEKVLTRDEWGDMKTTFRRVFQLFKTLKDDGINVLYISHVKEVPDEDTGVIWKRPYIDPKSLTVPFMGKVDIVANLVRQDNNVITYTVPHNRYEAKDRLHGCPAVSLNCTFGDLYEGIYGERPEGEPDLSGFRAEFGDFQDLSARLKSGDD